MIEIVQAREKLEVAHQRLNNAENEIEIDIAIAEINMAELLRKELILRKKGELNCQ